ncbi:MAG: hypothetical protein ACYDD1_18805 [Caulobacteraceae bacterium]
MALSIPTIALLGAAALGLTTCRHDKPKAAQQAQAAAMTATAQAALTQSVSTADQKANEKTVRVLITTQGAIHDVQAAPGANTALDPGELTAFRAGIQRVRDTAAGGNAGGDDPD